MNGWINIDDNLAVKEGNLLFGPGSTILSENNWERKTNIVWSYLHVQFSFFSLTYMELKHEEINITKLVLMIIKAWIFWVCWLSPTWYSVIVLNSYLIWCYQLQLFYLTVEHHPVKKISSLKLPQATFDTCLVTRRTFHTLQKSFLCFSCVYLSWNNKALYAKNFAFLPFLIIKQLQKFYNILKCMSVWQLS